MSALIKDRLMTADEFWEWDDGSYELVDGVPRLMSPHSDKHGTMQGNVIRVVGNHIVDNDLPCRVVPEGGVRPRLRAKYNHRKPDITLTCTPNDADNVYIPEPILIIEILSSNEGETRDNIRRFSEMESLREIVLFHQDEPLAEVWRRSEEGWPGIAEFIHGELVMSEPITVTGSVRLESIGLDLPFSEVFRKCDMRPRNKRRR
jgi:Uma2 family endonuclease